MKKIKTSIAIILALLFLVSCKSANSKEDFRVTTDWSFSEHEGFEVDGVIKNISDQDKKDVNFDVILTTKDDKVHNVGNVHFDELLKGSHKKFELNFTDEFNDTKYNLDDYKKWEVEFK